MGFRLVSELSLDKALPVAVWLGVEAGHICLDSYRFPAVSPASVSASLVDSSVRDYGWLCYLVELSRNGWGICCLRSVYGFIVIFTTTR